MGDTLVCPKCQERLWVAETQTPLLTCPKCLARVVDANVAKDLEVPQELAPRQVIPLESQTSSDMRETRRWLVVLASMLFGFGVLISLTSSFNVPSGLMMAAGLMITAVIASMYRKSPKVRETPAPYNERVQPGDVTVLEYANIKRRRDGSIGSFLSGFTLAMAICFLTLMGAGIGRSAGRMVSLLTLMTGAGCLIALVVRNLSEGDNRDFYNGLVAGGILGAMSCGPCAFMAALN